ncbi:AAA family ATPase [Micromonospora peucetia]|uniref:AAA family ATPase n=1 Tax=Micromonospora peucetia TaxID=47871 RepID=UPI003317A26D
MPLAARAASPQGDGLFRQLKLRNWRQFGSLQLEFDERLTIITGENGTGKSTVLRLLAQHLGWSGKLVATPLYHKGVLTFSPDARRKYTHAEEESNVPSILVGHLEYRDGQRTEILVGARVGGEYEPQLPSAQRTPGIFISSHRPVFQFQQIGAIPTTVMQATNVFNYMTHESVSRFQPGNGFMSPTFRMKETLVSWAIFGPGSDILAPNPAAMKAFRQFEDLLRLVLPEDLGFERIRIEMPEVVLETTSGKFPLEGASGGIATIIDLIWQLHLFSLAHPDRTLSLLIDEPENHLHPALQRELMPKLLRAFPNSQVVVATHSPFVVSADPSARVYALKFDSSRRVVAELLEGLDKSGSANDVLRSGLGLDVTVPVWVEEKLNGIAERLERTSNLNLEFIDSLRRELRESGLEEYAPDVLTRILGTQRRGQ